MKQFVYDARGFRERCEPGTITDVRTWRKGGDSAVHRATAVPAWRVSCYLQQRTAGGFYNQSDPQKASALTSAFNSFNSIVIL